MAELRKTLKIDPAVHKRLKVRAAQLGISMAELIDQATKEVLDNGPDGRRTDEDLRRERSVPK